ncbi:MAG: hypothetical protein HY318_08260 [Armatimonadetes bacterium]|nr:hypothetical protein [Armatimonadota bacterium]
MLLDGSTGCCGVDWGPRPVSLYRVFTRATPYVLLFIMAYPMLALLGRMGPPARLLAERLNEGFRKSMEMIERSQILPKQKCLISGRLFVLSPPLAGLFFRAFNLVVLVLMWVATAAVAGLACTLVL